MCHDGPVSLALPPPEDFARFWQETVAEAEAHALDFSITEGVRESPDHRIDLVTFKGMRQELQGWIAVPPGDSLPGFLWIPPYGRESLLPNEYGTRIGFVSMSFNFFGHDAFHQEKYIKERGYFADGVDSPATWIFRRMFQDAVIAFRVLGGLPAVDSGRVGSMGMSQGAGFSIWLGAWLPQVRAVCADMPFLGGMADTLSKSVHRYPLKELIDYAPEGTPARDRLLRTISYFDTVNQAKWCSKPTHISLGLKDPAARPANVRAVYEALPGEKELVEYDWGHDWHPEMVVRDRDWLLRWL